MIKLPLNGNWTQLNTSDRVGSLAYTKNINLDRKGYIKLSPRTVNIFDDREELANSSDTDFSFPVAFGRYDDGDFRLATTDEPFNISISDTDKTIAEDSSSNNPNLNFMSHGVWWQNRFHESTDTVVNYNSSGTWTASAITGLTSGKRHYMAVFASRTQLCVSDGNVVKQYDTSYANTTNLTIPSDYEVTGLAYNNSRMAVATRLGTDSEGQNSEARFYIWDGSGTAASSDAGVGTNSILAVRAYKTSFVIITSAGQLLYWNGGGFDELASFPFYFDDARFEDLLSFNTYGDIMTVDGDTILINIGFNIITVSRKQESYLVSNPSGVWCYDPEIGLYHKYSPSNSRAYLHAITEANVNTTTNIFTTSVTIPDTGNPVIMTLPKVTGLDVNTVYYVIKLSATTFKLATTKENAINLNAIDITAVDTIVYLWMYDIKDYGISYTTASGAISLFDTSNSVFKDAIFGGRIYHTDLNSMYALNMCSPFLENRGHFVTPKLFLNSTTENIQSITIKHAPLGGSDKIIVKMKQKDIFGIPTTTPNDTGTAGGYITWTSSTTATTDTDLSEAKTAFDNDDALEVELTAGLGAGQMINVTNLTETGGTYTITFEDEVVGYSTGLKSHFIIDNWKYLAEVDATTQTEGIFEVPIALDGKSPQFKVEMRGYNTTIEDMFIDNKKQLK